MEFLVEIELRIPVDLGAGFTPLDMASLWAQQFPILATCTAERAAYRNFIEGWLPPGSASRRNPYREWIGAQIRALLKPGSSFGETDVELDLTEPPPDAIQVFVDNQGVYSVGEFEGGLNFQHYGMLGIDDRFTLYGIAAHGNRNINLAYDIPVNPWSGRGGVSFSTGTTGMSSVAP